MNKQRKINLKLNEKTASGEYANLGNIIFNDSEFIIDFARILPGVNSAEIKSRIIMNPKNAKVLMKILENSIKNYENKYGDIDIPEKGKEGNIGFKIEEN